MAMTWMRRVEASSLESGSQFRVGLKSLVPDKRFPTVISVIPRVYLRVPNAQEAVSFYKAAFDAEDFFSSGLPMVRVNHGRIEIGLDELPDEGVIDDDHDHWKRDFYVENFKDVKATFNKAVAAGAKVLEGISKCQVDIYMEDICMARVKDPYGLTWTIRSRLKKKGYFANLWAALLYKY